MNKFDHVQGDGANGGFVYGEGKGGGSPSEQV